MIFVPHPCNNFSFFSSYGQYCIFNTYGWSYDPILGSIFAQEVLMLSLPRTKINKMFHLWWLLLLHDTQLTPRFTSLDCSQQKFSFLTFSLPSRLF